MFWSEIGAIWSLKNFQNRKEKTEEGCKRPPTTLWKTNGWNPKETKVDVPFRFGEVMASTWFKKFENLYITGKKRWWRGVGNLKPEPEVL